MSFVGDLIRCGMDHAYCQRFTFLGRALFPEEEALLQRITRNQRNRYKNKGTVPYAIILMFQDLCPQVKGDEPCCGIKEVRLKKQLDGIAASDPDSEVRVYAKALAHELFKQYLTKGDWEWKRKPRKCRDRARVHYPEQMPGPMIQL